MVLGELGPGSDRTVGPQTVGPWDPTVRPQKVDRVPIIRGPTAWAPIRLEPYFLGCYERLTHVSAMVVESQGAAGDEGEEGEAGGAHGENQLVVQVVKRNWLKDEIYVGRILSP